MEDGKFVCAQCFDDVGISAFIKDNAFATECSFCPAIESVPIATSIDDVAGYINECLHREYTDAEDEVPYISSLGEYLLPTYDNYEILDEIELEFPNDGYEAKLVSEIAKRLDDNVWCHINPFRGSDEEYVKYSWERFAEVTKHKRRFFFMDISDDEPDFDSPGDVLKTIIEYAEETGLFKTMPAGTQLFRARWEGNDSRFDSAEELGPPTESKAVQSNRMSPPGIVMFYGGESTKTAILETANKPDRFAIGRFETLRPAVVLDLTAIPPVPSLFETMPDDPTVSPRAVLRFLRHVAEQISQGIERDKRVHVDYVPTQIVTEYVRSQFISDRTRVDGIKYLSSVHPGHASYVLFATQDNILPVRNPTWPDARWLKLLSVCHVYVTEDMLK